MQDKPSTVELLAAVSALLKDQVVPALDGHLSLQVRIASNCLNIIRRELIHAASNDVAELERLESLLGESGDLETLNRTLCRRISNGELGLDDESFMDHLWRTTLAKIRIDQPQYPTYTRWHSE